MWLWNVQPHISFDQGSRIGEFCSFTSEEQFGPISEKLAQRAAKEVMRYRELFPTIRSVSDYYIKSAPDVGWPSFNAAVAHGLSGRIETAVRLFNTWGIEADDDSEWVKDAREDAKQLSIMVKDQEQFRNLISTRVRQTRELQKYPAITEIDFAAKQCD
jgi:hypothetical protein